MMVATLQEMKRHNRRIGNYFFDRGNPPVEAKRGNYLVTKSFSGKDYVVFEYNPKTGRIRLVSDTFPTKKLAVNSAEMRRMVNKA